MFAKLNNGQLEKFPYTLGMLRKDNPTVAFPKVISDEILSAYDIVSVTMTNQPDDYRKDYTTSAELQNGSWVQTWTAVDISQEELAQRTESRSKSVRERRNDLLSNCDWTQIADSPVDSASWAIYRQALRDVPAQEGFPWNVTWPNQPE